MCAEKQKITPNTGEYRGFGTIIVEHNRVITKNRYPILIRSFYSNTFTLTTLKLTVLKFIMQHTMIIIKKKNCQHDFNYWLAFTGVFRFWRTFIGSIFVLLIDFFFLVIRINKSLILSNNTFYDMVVVRKPIFHRHQHVTFFRQNLVFLKARSKRSFKQVVKDPTNTITIQNKYFVMHSNSYIHLYIHSFLKSPQFVFINWGTIGTMKICDFALKLFICLLGIERCYCYLTTKMFTYLGKTY